MLMHLMRLKVAPRDHASAARTIKSMIGRTKAKSGCLTCSLYTQVDNDDEFLLVEKWSSLKALDEHIRSKQYGLLLEVMELAVEKPLIEIHRTSETKGLAHIEMLRMADSSKKSMKRGISNELRPKELR